MICYLDEDIECPYPDTDDCLDCEVYIYFDSSSVEMDEEV